MAYDISKTIYVGIALAVLFIMLSTIIMPFFSTSFRYAQSVCWTNTTSQCDYDTTMNTSYVSKFCSAGVSGLGTYCQQVETAGGYRLVNQAIVMMILFFAMLGFALKFLPRRK